MDRLATQVHELFARERETRDRLIYIEGLLAASDAPIGRPRLPPR